MPGPTSLKLQPDGSYVPHCRRHDSDLGPAMSEDEATKVVEQHVETLHPDVEEQ